MLHRRCLTMPLVLNILGFWIYQGFEYVFGSEGSEYVYGFQNATVLNIPGFEIC